MPILLFGSSPSNALPPLGIDVDFAHASTPSCLVAINDDATFAFARTAYRTPSSPVPNSCFWTPQTGWFETASQDGWLSDARLLGQEAYVANSTDTSVRVYNNSGQLVRTLTTRTASTRAVIPITAGNALGTALTGATGGTAYSVRTLNRSVVGSWAQVHILSAHTDVSDVCGDRFVVSGVSSGIAYTRMGFRNASYATPLVGHNYTGANVSRVIGVSDTGTFIAHTEDSGYRRWTQASGITSVIALPNGGIINSIAYVRETARWYLATTAGLYESVNDGVTFTLISPDVYVYLTASTSRLFGAIYTAGVSWGVREIRV